jgi:hypothetical protein
MRGAISLGLDPFSHGASQNGIFFPFPTTIKVKA